uniref:hypothetical protein n=1 Tax=Siminovitchia sp. FSL W7-1587 TaxID=2954699 RepID=UPI00403E4383
MKTRVIDVRHFETFTKRNRRCYGCETRFATTESISHVYVDRGKKIVKDVYQ